MFVRFCGALLVFGVVFAENSNLIVGHRKFNKVLRNIVLDPSSGHLVVGGTNRLYSLSDDDHLKVLEEIVTGPRNDSYDCTVIECPQNSVRAPMDNYNKVLLVYENRLIACGSAYQGVCELRSLKNLSATEHSNQDSVVANTEEDSTFAFIAPGSNTNVLYVGVTFTGKGPYRSEIPAVSSRSLDKNRMFQIASTAVTTGTRIFINNYARESYVVNYIYGFSSDRYSYFLTTQPKHNVHSTSRQLITKLIRICQDDSNYYSYTEIPISCRSENINYNVVQGAYLGKPGPDLAPQLEVSVNDDVLFTVFVRDEMETSYNDSGLNGSGVYNSRNSNGTQENSAICVYSLKSIRAKFMYNIKQCFSGVGQRGLDFISPNMNCVPTKIQMIKDDFCGLDVNSPLGGEHPVTAVPLFVSNRNRFSGAILPDIANDAQVLIVANMSGAIYKLVFDEKQQQFIKYNTIDLRNGSVDNSFENSTYVLDRGLIFDKPKRHLIALTKSSLYKIKIAYCKKATTCMECIAMRDPYCGWCSLANQCTEKSECLSSSKETLHWVNGKLGKCTQIIQVQPKELQRTTARTLEITIENLPLLNGDSNLKCVFDVGNNKLLTTNATRKRNGVNCTTPRTDLLPPIAQGQNAILAELSLQRENGPKLVSTNFTFFDCSTHLTCTICVSSKYPCDWCVEAHRCTHDTAENCRNDILVTGVSRSGPSYRSGPSFCPTINSTGGDNTEILVSSGTKKSIKVRVHIIGQFIVQTRFVCQFNIEGRVTSANAQLLGDTIYCDAMEFLYTGRHPNLTAAFAVIWGGSKPLDNPHNIHIVIYRCRDMASNCGECLGLPEKYNCGWCSSSNSCEISEQCGATSGSAKDWLNRNEVCPNPEVLGFKPFSGPWEGGTNITIYGINLGKKYSDIYSGVKIAGISCMPYEELYKKTKEIVCQVDSPGVQAFRQGKIVVQIHDYRGESKSDYQFVDPKIYDFSPKFGPKSGGTTIKISGEYLNAGSNIKAFIDNLPCKILSADRNEALCKTSSLSSEKIKDLGNSEDVENDILFKGSFRMHFDNGVRELDKFTFHYVSDPKISYVTSSYIKPPTKPHDVTALKNPRGIPAGGLKVYVYGKNFNSIQQPQFIVRYNTRMFVNKCDIISSESMVCYTPEIDLESKHNGTNGEKQNNPFKQLDFDQPLNVEYDFILDDVKDVIESKINTPHTFELFPNPEYYPFEENVKFYKSEYLTINGRDLDLACQHSDVRVMIGSHECNVTSLSRSQLTCRPPNLNYDVNRADNQDKSSGEDEEQNEMYKQAAKDQYVVLVKIGNSNNLMFNIGVLSYAPPEMNFLNGVNRNGVIFIAVGFVVILVCFFAVLIYLYRKKTSESNRVLKNMQEQMDILELRVAAECKEAFAELQTEMTDLTTELISSGGIPFLDYRHYIMKILFPDQQNYYFLDFEKTNAGPNGELLVKKEKGLRLFGQLVMNKTFLLLFIRTLETNRYFSMRERVNVASLIMVTLQSKLEYCTDILKTLLAELIEKCMTDGKSHPRLLLRRTESVAEKMLSAWFTFLLHKFLKECAGEPLYMLYRAVKGQVDKGPIDAITYEARYSLSEEKLIRQLIDFKVITIYVTINQQIQQSHPQFHPQLHKSYSNYERESLGINETVHTNLTSLNDSIPVKVLDCDTIGQVKEKCLDTIYKNTPYTQRPQSDDLDLEWRTGNQGRMILYDEDVTSKTDHEWKKLNTLAHYNVPDGAALNLIAKQSSFYNSNNCISSATIDMSKKSTIRPSNNFNRTISPPLNSNNLNRNLDLIINTNQQYSSPDTFIGLNSNCRYWHLVKHDDNMNDNFNIMQNQKDLSKCLESSNTNKDAINGGNFSTAISNKDDSNRVNKMVSEIYLTRLLATKGALQKFVDDLFETIFSTAHRGSALPLAIKYMFDFLDDQALLHGITDPEVVHTWKSNSLPLRFWVNLIKNPNFVFDIHKSNIVDSCLSVVAQTFMDSCSTSGHRLGKDSPSSKLLYAKDIPSYRKWVERYYSDIKDMPAISDQDMNAMLAEESRLHTTDFNTNSALHELYTYAVKYNEQLTVTLEEDEFSQKQRLAYKLEQVHNIMSLP